MITPEQIANKKFSTVRLGRGYDQEEVDSFLDQVEADYLSSLQSNEELRRRITAHENRYRSMSSAPTAQLPPVRDVDQPSLETITLLLKSAQSTADQLVVDANTEAAQVTLDARAKAEQVLADARAEAERILADGHEKRHATIGALEAQRVEIERKVAGLQGVHRDLSNQLKGALMKLSFTEEK